jgi:hypothetical protein
MTYRVFDDPSIPRGMEGVYAYVAVRQAELRAEAERAEVEAREQYKREGEKMIAAALQRQAARRAAEEESQRAAQARGIQAAIRAQFFGANPTALESDFERLWPGLRDQHFRAEMERVARDHGTTEAKMRASGDYNM